MAAQKVDAASWLNCSFKFMGMASLLMDAFTWSRVILRAVKQASAMVGEVVD